MLNLSKENAVFIPQADKYKTIRSLENRPHYKILNRFMAIFGVILIIFMFLPWTQNISGTGAVTTLRPGQRPQTIHTTIAGRIEKWFVQEGQFVKKGDTIVYISEVKEDYLDPNLVENTKNQRDAKKSAAVSYGQKVVALEGQKDAIRRELTLKTEQARNKVLQAKLKIKSDSTDLIATQTLLRIANTQYNRAVTLNKDGLKPVTDVEEKRLKQQEMEAKIITIENKYLASKNELINAIVELDRIQSEYAEKVAKVESDQFTAKSSQYDTEAQVNKLDNQYVNYNIRNGMYYIIAPQDGYVNRALQSGVGEIIKEGTPVVSIMPQNFEIAVETFVAPIDLPLIKRGEKVRVWFDGWPTIVFSGWPDMSYGTFGGTVVAIENFISENGKYRVLIAPDNTDQQWPTQLAIGSGAQTIALLETVPVWFEIWRRLNGFPPNYYKGASSDIKSNTSNPKKEGK